MAVQGSRGSGTAPRCCPRVTENPAEGGKRWPKPPAAPFPSPQHWEPGARVPVGLGAAPKPGAIGRRRIAQEAELFINPRTGPSSSITCIYSAQLTRAAAGKPLRSPSYSTHCWLTQQVPGEGTLIHRISSELPGGAQTPPRALRCPWGPLGAWQPRSRARQHLTTGLGACSFASVKFWLEKSQFESR